MKIMWRILKFVIMISIYKIRLQSVSTIFLPDEKKMRDIWTKKFAVFLQFFFSFSRIVFFGGKEDRELRALILIFDFLLLRRMNNFWNKKQFG